MLVKYFGSRKYREGENGGSGSSGGSGTPPADLQAQIQAAVDAAVTGLKNKNQELLGKLTEATGKLKKIEGLDVDELTAFHAQFKDSKDLQDIKDGKIDEVLARRNEKFLQASEKKLKDAEDALAAKEAKLAKFSQRVLDDGIRAAATRAGVHKHAVDDALLAARIDFTLNDEGIPVQMRDGQIVMGKDGKTPFSPDEWFSMKADAKPHWFPSGNSGSEPPNGSGGNGSGKTMRRSTFDALPPGEKAKAAVSHRIVD